MPDLRGKVNPESKFEKPFELLREMEPICLKPFANPFSADLNERIFTGQSQNPKQSFATICATAFPTQCGSVSLKAIVVTVGSDAVGGPVFQNVFALQHHPPRIVC